jgi:S-adenosylmethionine:tRNA ribosyltransferase-isomerase
MHLKDYDYDLPPELIATHPLAQRAQSRLLCLDRDTGQVTHGYFYQILDFLNPNDCLILNNTRVIPARLFGQKATGGQVEILIERLLSDQQALVHIRASKSPKAGSELLLEQGLRLLVEEKIDSLYRVKLLSDKNFLTILDQIGHMPLPPYIQRADEPIDKEQYQTVYGHIPGAVAAPTAGLHFDQDLLEKIAAKGVGIGQVTLHVGAGTFQPVRVENILEHHMHSEWLEVSQEVCDLIQKTKARGGRVVAVGTTVVRSLETAAQSGELKPYSGQTQLFIYPGFKFHVPRSTLLMLVSAFAGREHVLTAYQQAIDHKYRFFSYGDAMWIAAKI